MFDKTRGRMPMNLRPMAIGLVLTSLVSTTAISAQPSPPPVPESTKQAVPQWYGVMNAEGREFRLVLERTPGEPEGAVHQLRSLDEGDRRFQLDGFQISDRLEFEVKLTGAKYSGQLAEDGQTATGKWSQRGAELDLTFHKVAAVPVDTAAEVWSGTLNAILQKLELRFRIYAADDGTKSVRMDSVTQEAGGFKGTLSINEDSWVIEVPMLQGTFTGKLNAARNELAGSWKQLGMPFDLKLTRVDPDNVPQVSAPQRPQTPRPPFPYQVREVTFENTADGVTLAGTLTMPEGGDRLPAAILISGSGPHDRDETLLDHKPFAVLADHLTRHGIAVLRFDDRGVGESTGHFDAATSEDFARDAEAAFDYLRQHSGIDPRRVGLIGHSEGGIIAPIVAARRREVAWIALLAGTGVDGREILLSQGERVLRAEGIVKDEDLQLQRAVQEGLLDAVIGSEAEADEQQLVRRATELVRQKVSDQQFRDKQLEAGIRQGIGQLSKPWFRFFLTYSPATALAEVRCPVLALNGEKDTQVDPELNLPAIEKALKHGHNPPFRGIVLPNLNHLFQTSKSGGVSEYQEIEETMSPRMLEVLTTWIHEQ